MFGKFLCSDDDANTITSKINFFLSFTSVKILIFYFVSAIYQLMKDLMQVFRYHYFTLWGMMYLMFVNISTRVSLSRFDISSRKSEITHQLSIIFQTNSLSNYSYFLLTSWIFTLLNFWSFTIYFVIVQKSIFNEKDIVNETTYKSLSRN